MDQDHSNNREVRTLQIPASDMPTLHTRKIRPIAKTATKVLTQQANRLASKERLESGA